MQLLASSYLLLLSSLTSPMKASPILDPSKAEPRRNYDEETEHITQNQRTLFAFPSEPITLQDPFLRVHTEKQLEMSDGERYFLRDYYSFPLGSGSASFHHVRTKDKDNDIQVGDMGMTEGGYTTRYSDPTHIEYRRLSTPRMSRVWNLWVAKNAPRKPPQEDAQRGLSGQIALTDIPITTDHQDDPGQSVPGQERLLPGLGSDIWGLLPLDESASAGNRFWDRIKTEDRWITLSGEDSQDGEAKVFTFALAPDLQEKLMQIDGLKGQFESLVHSEPNEGPAAIQKLTVEIVLFQARKGNPTVSANVQLSLHVVLDPWLQLERVMSKMTAARSQVAQ